MVRDHQPGRAVFRSIVRGRANSARTLPDSRSHLALSLCRTAIRRTGYTVISGISTSGAWRSI